MIARLHAVTDDEVLADRGFVDRARAVLRAGGADLALHLRGPGTVGARIWSLAAELLPEARQTGSRLVINDRADVALAVGVDGLHLGQRSLPAVSARALVGPDVRIGVSVHDRAEAERARDGEADYLFAGSIYATRSHPELAPAGPELLEELRTVAGAPLVAIGGMIPERVPEVLEAGASGVAAVGAVWRSGGRRAAPDEAVRAFIDAFPSPIRVRST